METNEKNNLTENRSLPVIGKSYIIEILSAKGIDKKTYPYSSIVVFEKFIEVKHF